MAAWWFVEDIDGDVICTAPNKESALKLAGEYAHAFGASVFVRIDEASGCTDEVQVGRVRVRP